MDNFNNAIRKKIEDFNPEYNDSEWEDMKKFMVTAAYQTERPFFYTRYKPMLMGLAAVLIFASLLYNLKMYNENKRLVKIITMQNKINRKIASMPLEIHPRDTIYITKFIVKYFNRPSVEAAKYYSNKDYHLTSNNINKFDSYKNSYEKTDLLESRVLSEPEIRNNINHQRTKEGLNGSNFQAVREMDNVYKNSDSSNKSQSETQNNDVDLSVYSLSMISRNSNLLFETNISLPRILFSPKENDKKPSDAHFPNISLKNAKHRYGINVLSAHEQSSYGPVYELLINPRWAVNCGLNFNQSIGKEYYTADQYLNEKNEDFRKNYAPYVKENFDILNIKFINNSVQVPLGLSYRFLLKNDFTAFTGLGTDLNILSWQNLTFDYKEDNNQYMEGKYQGTNRIPILENANFVIGLEKKYKNYVFQIQPYLRTNTHLDRNWIAGVKFRLMYQPSFLSKR